MDNSNIEELLKLRKKYPNKDKLRYYFTTSLEPKGKTLFILDDFNAFHALNDNYDKEIDFILNSPILTLYERNPKLYNKIKR